MLFIVSRMLSRLFKFNSIRTVTTTPSGTYGMLYARKYKGSVSNDTESKLVYSGPFSPAVKAIKLVSLVSSSTALSVTPFLIAFGKEGIPLLGKSMIVSIAGTLGVSFKVDIGSYLPALLSFYAFDTSLPRRTSKISR